MFMINAGEQLEQLESWSGSISKWSNPEYGGGGKEFDSFKLLYLERPDAENMNTSNVAQLCPNLVLAVWLFNFIRIRFRCKQENVFSKHKNKVLSSFHDSTTVFVFKQSMAELLTLFPLLFDCSFNPIREQVEMSI